MLKHLTPTPRRTLAATLTLTLLTASAGYAAWAVQPPRTQLKAATAAAAAANAGERPVSSGIAALTKNVTVQFRLIPLPEAARRVAAAGHVDLVNPEALNASKRVEFDFKDLAVGVALEILAGEDHKALLVDGNRVTFVESAKPLPKPASAPSSKPAAAKRTASVDVGTQRPPRYPASAAAKRQTGIVVVLVDVTPEGRVAHAEIQKSVPAGVFDQATLDAVKDWTFEPAIKDGKPVAGRVRVPVTFDMDDDGAPAPPVSGSTA